MAVRVQNGADINFGTFATAVTVSHIRIQKSGAAPSVKALQADVAVGANENFRIPEGDLDVLYPSGDLSDAHMDALVKSYWNGETFQIDAMTDDSTVVTASGYSQQTTSDWDFSTENDPA